MLTQLQNAGAPPTRGAASAVTVLSTTAGCHSDTVEESVTATYVAVVQVGTSLRDHVCQMHLFQKSQNSVGSVHSAVTLPMQDGVSAAERTEGVRAKFLQSSRSLPRGAASSAAAASFRSRRRRMGAMAAQTRGSASWQICSRDGQPECMCLRCMPRIQRDSYSVNLAAQLLHIAVGL